MWQAALTSPVAEFLHPLYWQIVYQIEYSTASLKWNTRLDSRPGVIYERIRDSDANAVNIITSANTLRYGRRLSRKPPHNSAVDGKYTHEGSACKRRQALITIVRNYESMSEVQHFVLLGPDLREAAHLPLSKKITVVLLPEHVSPRDDSARLQFEDHYRDAEITFVTNVHDVPRIRHTMWIALNSFGYMWGTAQFHTTVGDRLVIVEAVNACRAQWDAMKTDIQDDFYHITPALLATTKGVGNRYA